MGTTTAAFGCGCFITEALGSELVTAFVMGLSISTTIQFGMIMNIFNLICFVIVLVWDRKRINIGTVLYTFTLGTFCNIFIALLTPLGSASLLVRVGLIVIGTIATGFGLGF